MDVPTQIIASEIDNSYIQSIDTQTRASLFLINPRGPMRNVYLDFYAWFLKLYLYTSSTSDVSGRINEVKLREKVEEWFSDKSCNAGTLAMGIKLHREYVAILQETGTIIIRRN